MFFLNKFRRKSKVENIKVFKPKIELHLIRKIVINVLLPLFVSFTLTMIFYSPLFKISKIEFERDDLSIDPSQIINSLNELKGKNILFTSIGEIEKKVQENNREFKNIKLKKKLPDIVSIKVESFENIFVLNTFFDKENELTKLKERYIQKFYISQGGKLKDFVGDESVTTSNVLSINSKEDTGHLYSGDIYLTPDIIYKIQVILEKVKKNYKFEIIDIDLYKSGREIRIGTSLGELWITFTKDLDKQLEKVKLFRKNYGEGKQFSYLDLRINDRIVYKE